MNLRTNVAFDPPMVFEAAVRQLGSFIVPDMDDIDSSEGMPMNPMHERPATTERDEFTLQYFPRNVRTEGEYVHDAIEEVSR